jgi:hypothetical protein
MKDFYRENIGAYDHIKSGIGTLRSIKRNVVKGHGTCFTKETTQNAILRVRMGEKRLVELRVLNVVDDETAEVATQGLEDGNIDKPYKILPKIDQKKLFDVVYWYP